MQIHYVTVCGKHGTEQREAYLASEVDEQIATLKAERDELKTKLTGSLVEFVHEDYAEIVGENEMMKEALETLLDMVSLTLEGLKE